ncbi:hypothetical protein C8R45DRAFT_1220116 [Mycena sanguinolenta]|nr:hypothetical protein C8R45DRAFT_1220116 [Mycena sanguinolenta]
MTSALDSSLCIHCRLKAVAHRCFLYPSHSPGRRNGKNDKFVVPCLVSLLLSLLATPPARTTDQAFPKKACPLSHLQVASIKSRFRRVSVIDALALALIDSPPQCLYYASTVGKGSRMDRDFKLPATVKTSRRGKSR